MIYQKIPQNGVNDIHKRFPKIGVMIYKKVDDIYKMFRKTGLMIYIKG